MDDTAAGSRGLSRRSLIGASILMGGAAAVGVARPSAASAQAPGYDIGDHTPHLLAHDSTGHRVPLASFRGRPVLLELGAVWCGPCVIAAGEIPGLRAELDQSSEHRPVAIVTALVDGPVPNQPATRVHARNWHLRYPGADVVLHPDGDFNAPLVKSYWEGYGTTASTLAGYGGWPRIPTWVGISPSGTIVGYHVGWEREPVLALGRQAQA